MEQERGNIETAAGERMTAMAELLKLALPPASAPEDEQAEAFRTGASACACPWRCWMPGQAHRLSPGL